VAKPAAALSLADIASPIRTVFRRQPNVSVVLANVFAIDAARNEVIAEGAPHPVQLPDRRNRRAASLSVSASPPPSSCGLLLRSSSAPGALRIANKRLFSRCARLCDDQQGLGGSGKKWFNVERTNIWELTIWVVVLIAPPITVSSSSSLRTPDSGSIFAFSSLLIAICILMLLRAVCCSDERVSRRWAPTYAKLVRGAVMMITLCAALSQGGAVAEAVGN
jgi:hypothetical protein